MPKYRIRTSYTWLEWPSLMLQVLFDTAINISLNADIFRELNWLIKKKEESTVCASTCAIWYCCRLACLKRKTPQRKSAAVLLKIIACPEGKKKGKKEFSFLRGVCTSLILSKSGSKNSASLACIGSWLTALPTAPLQTIRMTTKAVWWMDFGMSQACQNLLAG